MFESIPKDLWLAVLSSSLITSIVGGCLVGWFNLRSKQNDYANEYFKLVIKRRVGAYEAIEALITMLKTAVLDTDGKPYHILFSNEENKIDAHELIFKISATSLWISDELERLTRDLSILIYEDASDSEANLIEFGKRNYEKIANLRTNIEQKHAKDMRSLHLVEKFLKAKKPATGFHSIKVRN